MYLLPLTVVFELPLMVEFEFDVAVPLGEEVPLYPTKNNNNKNKKCYLTQFFHPFSNPPLMFDKPDKVDL